MITFIFVWFGQLISLIGSSLTGFALGVWIYQTTGSVTNFALITLSQTLPLVLISLVAGTIVDRQSRRWVMIISDSGSGLCTLAIAILLATGNLQVWHIYVTTAISSSLSAFQWPAYTAATTLLVPKEQLSRASTMVELGSGIAQLIAPSLAGVLLGIVGLRGIIVIDFVTFTFAMITLICVSFPELETITTGSQESDSLWEELVYGLTYITNRPGLLGLLIYSATINLFIGFVVVLLQPLVLSFFSPIQLGIIESIRGFAMLAGSFLMIIWSGPKHRVMAMFADILLSAAAITLIGWHSSMLVMCFGAFLFSFGLPIYRTCSQFIWQTKVAPEVQGRVFALKRMASFSSLPLAALIAGPIDEYIFEPLMAVDGPLAASMGQIIGVGPGHGIDLLFIVVGFLLILTTFFGYIYPPLRLVQDELPDAMSSKLQVDLQVAHGDATQLSASAD
jgi:DHA3 family macrolide efflux protein-like MFS transporter